MLPLYHDRFTFTSACCFMYIRVFLNIGALSLVEKRGQNCKRLSCPLVREADGRLDEKEYRGEWRSGLTSCLSPVA
jgi:hypothetical protein